jgi:Leucine-rich repeat (LRR) protein
MLKNIIALILITSSCASAITIICETQNNPWTPFGVIKECLVRNVVSIEPSTEVSIVNFSNDRHGDFESLYIWLSPSCQFLPKNIPKYFDNLQVLVLAHTGIQSITKEDLKPFEKLRGLYIDHGRLTAIDGDLFRYTKNLEELSLQNNMIKYVEADIFKRLRQLTSFSFDLNPCLNSNAKDRDAVEMLFIEIESKCHVRDEHRLIESEITKAEVQDKSDESKLDSSEKNNDSFELDYTFNDDYEDEY